MNELLKQFLDESRELLENAGAALLVLEDHPSDMEALNNLFRFVHTIKGGAGLFDPPGLVPTLHAAEDLLDHLREHQSQLTPDMTDVLLRAMDQVALWFDELDDTGEIASNQASVGEVLAKDLRLLIRDEAGAEDASRNDDGAPLSWLESIPSDLRAPGYFAIQFTPAEDCFFTGGNPLATVLGTPDTKWVSAIAREPWGEGADFDLYRCNLAFRIVSAAARDDIDMHFADVSDVCCIQPTGPNVGEEAPPTLRENALPLDLLKFQADALVSRRVRSAVGGARQICGRDHPWRRASQGPCRHFVAFGHGGGGRDRGCGGETAIGTDPRCGGRADRARARSGGCQTAAIPRNQ